METPVLSYGKEDIMPIGTNTRQRDTLVDRGGVKHQLLLTEAMRCYIERAAVEVVLYLRVGRPDILVAHLFRKRNRLAVVEVLAVRRPCGIHLQQRGVVADNLHRVGFHIIENQVAFQVINLDFIGILRMECLTC